MVAITLETPYDIAQQIAAFAQAKRLTFNLSQHSLSARSGVSFGVIKKFERTGKISLESLLKIALVLECLDEFTLLFKPLPLQKVASLDEMIRDKKRKRGRQ